MNEDTQNTPAASEEGTGTSASAPVQDAAVGAKASTAKSKGKQNATVPPTEVTSVQEKAAPPVLPVDPPMPDIVISSSPINSITKDTHTRIVQYLGIVNPGVMRILFEMLKENEQKLITLFSNAGVKVK